MTDRPDTPGRPAPTSPDRPAPDRPADRLSAAFETLARRGSPQDPDVFAAAVLRAARAQHQRSAYTPWLVGAAAAAAIGGAFAVAAVVNNDTGGDRVVPATNTSDPTATTQTTSVPHSTLFFAPQPCEPIPFTPNSEDMATNVMATASQCRDAELLIRKVRAQHNFYDGPRRFEVDGFQCTVTVRDSEQDPIPSADYDCRRGENERVTWTKT